MSKKKNKELENGSFEETIEMRMTDLETQMTMFKTVFIRDTEKNTKPIKRLKNLEETAYCYVRRTQN